MVLFYQDHLIKTHFISITAHHHLGVWHYTMRGMCILISGDPPLAGRQKLNEWWKGVQYSRKFFTGANFCEKATSYIVAPEVFALFFRDMHRCRTYQEWTVKTYTVFIFAVVGSYTKPAKVSSMWKLPAIICYCMIEVLQGTHAAWLLVRSPIQAHTIDYKYRISLGYPRLVHYYFICWPGTWLRKYHPPTLTLPFHLW